MLRPDLQLILSPQAEEDFADILQYTLETWVRNKFMCTGQ
jgi:toxin ParE1/3/4